MKTNHENCDTRKCMFIYVGREFFFIKMFSLNAKRRGRITSGRISVKGNEADFAYMHAECGTFLGLSANL